jgi:hypothetical protein
MCRRRQREDDTCALFDTLRKSAGAKCRHPDTLISNTFVCLAFSVQFSRAVSVFHQSTTIVDEFSLEQDLAAVVDCVPGTWSEARPKRYLPISVCVFSCSPLLASAEPNAGGRIYEGSIGCKLLVYGSVV